MLTPKQERFCQKYIETGNASEAYRQSYDSKNMQPDTIHTAAQQLLDNYKVIEMVDELQNVHKNNHNITIESITAELEKVRRLAFESGNYSAVISATMGKAKMHGFLEKGNKKNGEIQFVLVDENDMKL